ncbi:R8 protein [Pestalotiopsis sp. IQ-011]
MVLLTSSQVSVALSSLIVISCTTALFLSGYVIQQRTLRDLRKAIRPDPRPSPKIYLPDRFKQSTTELEDGTVVNIEVHDAPSGNAAQQKKGDFVVEVRPSVPEDASQRPLLEVKGRSEAEDSLSEKDSASEDDTSEDDTKKQDTEKPAENKDEEEPMSRAERRRRIKEEIRELSQGETPMYYQRRLW